MPIQKVSMNRYRGLALTAAAARRLKKLMAKKARLQMSPLRLYEPIPMQKRFHQSNAPERMALGANRGAKTTTCAMEVAWAVTGTHPWLDYPKENGRCVCVAMDEDKIGEIMFRKLFKREAFWMKRSHTTGKMRSWRPWVDGCYDHHGLVRCLPLIDPDLLDKSKGDGGIAWERKALNIPKIVYLRNGWEISFYSGLGSPPQGIDVDLVWLDEEIRNEAWYPEISARLIDRNGRMIWSATPQSSTQALWDLYERWQVERNDPDPKIEVFQFLLDDNPFLSPEAKDLIKIKFANDPEEYAVRVLGQFRYMSERVYPQFSKLMNFCEPFPIPGHWTRWMVVDPGFANTCCLFFAVPPKTEKPFVYLYDELYAHQCDVDTIAKRVRQKIGEQVIHGFLIDEHGGRRGEMVGKSISLQFAEAFERECVSCQKTRHRLIGVGEDGYTGHNPKNDAIEQVRSWLVPRGDLKPKLQVFEAFCQKFVGEITRYRYKKVRDRVTNKTDDAYSHGPDALRYAVTYGIHYVEPPKPSVFSIDRLFQMLEAKENGRDYIRLGPRSRT